MTGVSIHACGVHAKCDDRRRQSTTAAIGALSRTLSSLTIAMVLMRWRASGERIFVNNSARCSSLAAASACCFCTCC